MHIYFSVGLRRKNLQGISHHTCITVPSTHYQSLNIREMNKWVYFYLLKEWAIKTTAICIHLVSKLRSMKPAAFLGWNFQFRKSPGHTRLFDSLSHPNLQLTNKHMEALTENSDFQMINCSSCNLVRVEFVSYRCKLVI